MSREEMCSTLDGNAAGHRVNFRKGGRRARVRHRNKRGQL
jgi:hypothetical protein